MLETVSLSAVRPSSAVRAATLPVSLGLHLFAAAVAVFLSVWVVNFPAHPPDQFSFGPIIRTTPVPEPLGSPAPPRSSPAPEQRPVPATEPTAPAEIPDSVPVLSRGTPSFERAEGAVSTEAGEGGNSAGTPWGAAGGVDSGIVSTGLALESGPPLPVGGDVKAPRILQRVEPLYPQAMVKLRREGVVVVQCVIDRNGNVREAEVLRSPHPMFNDAAVKAIREWRFGPGTLNGRPVDVTFVLTIHFELK